MTLGIGAIFYRRPEISRAFLWHLEYLKEFSNCEIKTFFVYSTEEEKDVLKKLSTKGDTLIKVSENNVGLKLNVLANTAFQTDITHLMILGNDDFISKEYLQCITEDEYMQCAGVNDIAIVEPATKRAVLWEYRRPEYSVCGAGRTISRDTYNLAAYRAIVKFNKYYENYKKNHDYVLDTDIAIELIELGLAEHVTDCYALWDNLNKGLDQNSETRIHKANIAIDIKQFEQPQIIDVKGADNIHPFRRFQDLKKLDYDSLLNRIMPTISFD